MRSTIPNLTENTEKERMPQAASSAGGEMMTVQEVAARLRIAPSWVYTHANLLGAYRVGKYLRFSWNRVLERLSA